MRLNEIERMIRCGRQRELNYRTYSCHRGAGGNGCMTPRHDFEIVALFCAARTAFRLPDALSGSFSNTLHILKQPVLKAYL